MAWRSKRHTQRRRRGRRRLSGAESETQLRKPLGSRPRCRGSEYLPGFDHERVARSAPSIAIGPTSPGHLLPGYVPESESLWGEWYEKPGGKWPGEVGPIAIEGAEPGDTLVVEVLKVRPNHDIAASTHGVLRRTRGGDRVRFWTTPSPRPLRLEARSRAHDGEDDASREREQDRTICSRCSDDRGGTPGRGGLCRYVARRLRRQHGRARSPRGHDSLPSDLSRRRLRLLRRRTRPSG